MPEVFIVDDDPEVVALLACLIEQDGHEVVAFTSAGEALRAIVADPPVLVLLDLLMPEIDGAELCRLVKSDPHTAHVLVYMLSGHGYLEREAEEAGADGYIGKPFDLEAVSRCVADALAAPGRALEAL